MELGTVAKTSLVQAGVIVTLPCTADKGLSQLVSL